MFIVRSAALTLALVLLALPGRGAAGPVQRFGIVTGATLTNRSFAGATVRDLDTEEVWGWLLGGRVQWFTPIDRLFLTTEVLLLEKGYARQIGSETFLDDDQYVSLPFLATYDLMRHPTNFHIFGGPSIEILKGDPAGLGRSNLGLHIGGGVRLGNFEIDARYAHDLTDATGSSPSGPRTVTNRGVFITFGLGIDPTRRAPSTP